LTPGTRLGPYEILALIGAGGMGQVYRALDTTLDRMVAIKVLPDLSFGLARACEQDAMPAATAEPRKYRRFMTDSLTPLDAAKQKEDDRKRKKHDHR
jgi:hypothetical protein